MVTGINLRPDGAGESQTSIGSRNAYKLAMEGQFIGQTIHTLSHEKKGKLKAFQSF